MTGFADRLERELHAAATRRWSVGEAPRRRPRRVVEVAAAAAVVVVAVLAVLVLRPGGDSEHHTVGTTSGWTTFTDAARHVTLRYPPSWQRATSRLTPNLSDPREVVSVGSGSLPVGGDACAQFPTAALAALGPHDTLVSIQERRNPVAEVRTPRPARFTWADGTDIGGETRGCSGGSFTARWFVFGQDGRGFYGLVALGPQASAAERRQALAVLTSLRVTP